MSDVTGILFEIEQGDPAAAEKLLPLVYDELRRLAATRLAQERPGQTLQPTALVHEAYLRLVRQPDANAPDAPAVNWNSRAHFFGAAAEAMRRILVEQARRKNAAKRGGERQRVELGDLATYENSHELDLLELDAALAELAKTDAQAAELVKLRYFTGLSSADAAGVLGVSPRTADRIWLYARTWLKSKLASP